MRFNTALATNARLRNLIDHLRQEKLVFEGLQKKLQRVCVRNYVHMVLMLNDRDWLVLKEKWEK